MCSPEAHWPAYHRGVDTVLAGKGGGRQRVGSGAGDQQRRGGRHGRPLILGSMPLSDRRLNRRIDPLMTRSVIVAAVRTPVGRFGSALRSRSAVELGAVAIAEALARAGVSPAEVDYVLMGQVLQAGTGQITARQAAIAAGIPQQVPAITLNKVCLSSLTAVALADQLIRAGEIEVAVAGGMESMTNAPYVAPGARWGVRMGSAELVDTMVHDGLWSTFTGQHMGRSSDEVNADLGVTRPEQDAWAARSHR